MTVNVFDTEEVQTLLNAVAGIDKGDEPSRMQRIMHRLVGDLYRLIDDFDITQEEYWAAVNLLNTLGEAHEAPLLSAGLGFDHYLDLREDAIEAEAKRTGGTPRTIEGPLYVAGAPESVGYARMDDGSDHGSPEMWLTGQVTDVDGTPLAGAKVEIWHANSKGNYSIFDASQTDYNLRRTIYTDDDGYYRARSIIPSGYGCPEGGPTDSLLKLINRHGQRPAHIHYFISAAGHTHLTTQINLAGDKYTYDDFAFATRDELVRDAVPYDDASAVDDAMIDQAGFEGPLRAVTFDVSLTRTDELEKQHRHKRERAREDAA